MTFPSRTKLHKHLRAGCQITETEVNFNSPKPNLSTQSRDSSSTEILDNDMSGSDNSTIPVVESNAVNSDLGNGFAFRSWSYATAVVKLHPHSKGDNVCMDTGCGVTLIDKLWLLSELLDVYIAKMLTPLKVRGVGASKYETSEYVTIPIYLPATKDGR